MSRSLTTALVAVLVAAAVACSSSSTGPKTGSGGSPAGVAPTPTPDATRRKQIDSLINAIGGGKSPATTDDGDTSGEGDVVVDPSTKQRLQRIPKQAPYYLKQDRVYNSVIGDTEGVPIVKEDASYFYIAAIDPIEKSSRAPMRPGEEVVDTQRTIVDLPVEEGEIVTPKPSSQRLRFEEMSDGLPKTGMWRENFAVADLDGDGRPEIVSPPPRLAGGGLRIFKLSGKTWKVVTPEIEDPEGIGFEYGGVAVADMDGDGRPDIVYGGHGRSPMIVSNLGNFRFRIDHRGIAPGLSTRDMAIGDIDGDGRNDIVAVSDIPEYTETGGTPRPMPRGYTQGYDVRAYLNGGKQFQELTTGLHRACYAYSIALRMPKPNEAGEPFFVTGCRYFSGTYVLYTFNRKTLTFDHAGLDIVELYAAHLGSAVGTYAGHPAAFVTYLKNDPSGASRKIGGSGLTIYYREGDGWKRKRVLKTVGPNRSNMPGIAVGDLNGDGLDDIVVADEAEHRVRVLLQTPSGEFEEIDRALEPTFVNHPTCVRLADVDGDGRLDIIMMYQYLTGDGDRSGGFRVFRSVR